MESQLGNVEIYPPSPPPPPNRNDDDDTKRGMLFDVPWIIILIQFIVILALVLGLFAFFLTRSESSTPSVYSTRTYQNFELQTLSPSSSPLTFRRRYKSSTETPSTINFDFSEDLEPTLSPVVLPMEVMTPASTTSKFTNGYQNPIKAQFLENVNSVEVFENDENLRAAVFTSSKICSEIGKSILVRGGNAVDAAIAASFCLMGGLPNKASLGGGMMMTVKRKNGNVTTVIARESAPMNINLEELKKNPELSHVGPKASGTPGVLNGLYRAFQKFSSNRIQWKHLVTPTIQQCNKGFDINEDFKNRSNAPALASFFKANMRNNKLFCNGLSSILTEISDYENPLDSFYKGEMAQKLVKEIGGYLADSDLEDYESDMASALCTDIDADTKVCGPGPPSSFAVLANTYLTTKNMSNLSKVNEFVKSSQGLTHKIGDPMFVKSSKKYAEELSKTSKRTSVETKEIHVNFKENGSTEVFVIDENNMTVSVTLSLGDEYFDMKNDNVPLSIQPGKVPTTMISPIIVVKNNSVLAVSGGSDLLGLVHLLRDITHRNYDASKVAPSLFVQNSAISLKSPSSNKFSITGY